MKLLSYKPISNLCCVDWQKWHLSYLSAEAQEWCNIITKPAAEGMMFPYEMMFGAQGKALQHLVLVSGVPLCPSLKTYGIAAKQDECSDNFFESQSTHSTC